MARDATTGSSERDFAGYGRARPRFRWPNDAAVALNLVVNYEEGAEYSLRLGDERGESAGELGYANGPVPDLHVESVFEYGTRAGVWRLLRLFEEYAVPATFFACALAIEGNPAVGAALRDARYDVCSHGWRFTEHWTLSEAEEREHIGRAVASLAESCGERPLGWYSRYAPSENTRRLVVEEGGFIYDSDACNDDLPYFTQVDGKEHLVVPYNTLPVNDARFVTPSGYGAGSDFVEMCTRSIDELRREGRHGYGSLLTIGLHPRFMGQPSRTSALREVIEAALACDDVWVARRVDVARFWLEQRPGVDRR